MSEIQRLREIVEKLRGPDGCPWDREQTHQSLVRCLLEEVSETLEAIDNEDYELMKEELGDLLLQVVFHSLLAEEKSEFDLEEVARGINQKLIRRHPHVFGDEQGQMKSTDDVIDRWEKIKAEEKRARGVLTDESSIFKKLPPRMPALLFALDVYKRAAKAGLEAQGDWNEKNVEKLADEMDEESLGKAFFELVAACRKAGVDPESVLRRFASVQVGKLETPPA